MSKISKITVNFDRNCWFSKNFDKFLTFSKNLYTGKVGIIFGQFSTVENRQCQNTEKVERPKTLANAWPYNTHKADF